MKHLLNFLVLVSLVSCWGGEEYRTVNRERQWYGFPAYGSLGAVYEQACFGDAIGLVGLSFGHMERVFICMSGIPTDPAKPMWGDMTPESQRLQQQALRQIFPDINSQAVRQSHWINKGGRFAGSYFSFLVVTGNEGESSWRKLTTAAEVDHSLKAVTSIEGALNLARIHDLSVGKLKVTETDRGWTLRGFGEEDCESPTITEAFVGRNGEFRILDSRPKPGGVSCIAD